MDKTWVVNADCSEVDLDVQLLFTESCCDFLYINGVQYKGNNDPFQVCVIFFMTGFFNEESTYFKLSGFLQLDMGKKQLILVLLNPPALVAQKIADELVVRRLQGAGIEFSKIGPH